MVFLFLPCVLNICSETTNSATNGFVLKEEVLTTRNPTLVALKDIR